VRCSEGITNSFLRQRLWIIIFQYPVAATVAAMAIDTNQAAGVCCEYVIKPYFTRLWVSGDEQIVHIFLIKLTVF
jgi:hypothetical protein